MKIMSWNVNQFYGMGRDNNIEKIVSFIKGFLVGDVKNVVILQEISSDIIKKEKYKDIFPEPRYMFHIQDDSASGPNFTIAISNKIFKNTKDCPNWEKCECFNNKCNEYKDTNKNFKKTTNDKEQRLFDNFFKNKYVELSYKANNEEIVRVLGVHMPMSTKNIKEEDGIEKKEPRELSKSFWNILAEYAKSKEKEKFIIIGDFNAYDGENSSYRTQYNAILGKQNDTPPFVDVIPQNVKTCVYTTEKKPIDHVLKSNTVEIKSADVLDDIKLSDHYPIVAEIYDEFFYKGGN